MQRHHALFEELGLSPDEVLRKAHEYEKTGTWVYVPQTGRYWCDAELRKLFCLHHRQALTENAFWDSIHPEDKAAYQQAFSAAQTGKALHLVHRLCVGGTIKWVEQSAYLCKGEQNSAPYLLGTVRDVTQKREKELQLEARRADFAAITQYLAETTDTTSLPAIVASVKRTIRRRMDVAIIGVFVRQEDKITRVMPKDMDPRAAFLFQEIEDFAGYKAVTTGRRCEFPVAQYPTELGRKALEEMGGKFLVAMPIKHDGVCIGALSIITRGPGGFTAREDEFCRTICGYLSSQLNHVLLYGRLCQELEQRVRMESDRDAIFNEGLDFVAIFDDEGRFTQINPAFAQRLGVSQDVLVGQQVFDYIHPDDRAWARRVFYQMPSTGIVRGLCNRFLTQGGDTAYLENNLKYMPSTRCTIAMARDVTDQRKMEERNTLLEEMVAFERTKSDFFASLSHEFKTPLNIILSSLDLMQLKSKKEDEARFEREYAKFFQYAYQNCYRLLRLSSNLLDASQLEDGRYRLHVTNVVLDELLQHIVDAAEVYANAREVSVQFDYRGKRHVTVACDEDGVERIVLNLLSNAIKNSRKGGRVHLTLRVGRDACTIGVKDNGTGIAPEALPHIFDKFMTSRNPVSGQREGSGIGLSLVKSLTELHGGKVTAQSEVGVGSLFTFTLSRHLIPCEERERPMESAVKTLTKLEFCDVK